MTETAYVHGYSGREGERLLDQAQALTELLHHDIRYPAGSRVLEAGCGVGAQTIPLARNSPGARFTAVDLSAGSLELARDRAATAGLDNVTFQQADLFGLPFAPGSFDHAFVCFVLEHLRDPRLMLRRLGPLLKPGGSLTVIEGDHGSAFFHPDSAVARRVIGCLVELQARAGGNALLGRQLYPLLTDAGFRDVRVSPRMVYVDASRPELVEGFTRRTFTAMVEGVGEKALAARMLDRAQWQQGIADLYRTAEADGTFCYTFFKGVALR